MTSSRSMHCTITVPINVDIKWDKEAGVYKAQSKVFNIQAIGTSMEKAEYHLRLEIQSFLGGLYHDNSVLERIKVTRI